MTRTTMVFIALSFCVACESSPQQNGNHKPVEKKIYQIDASAIVKRVELARDRTFENPPAIKGVANYQPMSVHVPEQVQKEYGALTNVFQGKSLRLTPEPPSAHFEQSSNAVVYDATRSGDRDVFLTLTQQLDEPLRKRHEAKTVDAWFASRAVDQMAPRFALLVDNAQKIKPSLTAEMIAGRPDVAYQFTQLSPGLRDFTTREGLTFAAALYRANGWSGVEYGLAKSPQKSGHISRPDRWLGGEGLGTWKLAGQEIAPDGFEKSHGGQIGPAFLERWFLTFLEPNEAASIHRSWASDTYELFTNDDQWVFHFVSMWSTPAEAQTIVEAIDFGLRQVVRDATFAVIRHGTKVAVVGVSHKELEKHLEPAPLIAQSSVQFFQSEDRVLSFRPTAFDELMRGQRETTHERDVVFEPASGFRFPVDLGRGWTVEVPETGALRWYATHDDKTMIQCNVELFDPLGADFTSEKYGVQWQSSFKETMVDANVKSVGLTKISTNPAWTIELTGKQKETPEEISIAAWQMKSGEFVATLSLISKDDAHRDLVDRLVNGIESTKHVDRRPKGSIEYTVE